MNDRKHARRGRMLRIEDNPADVELMSAALEDVGAPIDLVACLSGDEALAMLQGTRGAQRQLPDLIVLDLNLNGLHGHDVLRALKSDETTRAIPVVVCSSSQSAQDIGESYARGASAYMSKCMHFDEMRDAVEHLVRYWFSAAMLPSTAQA